MSQEMIIDWLKSHPNRGYTAEELRLHLGLTTSIYANLKKLREAKQPEIEWKIIEINGLKARVYNIKKKKWWK